MSCLSPTVLGEILAESFGSHEVSYFIQPWSNHTKLTKRNCVKNVMALMDCQLEWTKLSPLKVTQYFMYSYVVSHSCIMIPPPYGNIINDLYYTQYM